MCKAVENFLLCTCVPADEPLEPPYWILMRDNTFGRDSDAMTRFHNEIVGIFEIDMGLDFDPAEPDEDAKKERERRYKFQRYICDELNTRQCFDFKYSPAFDDVLTIKLTDMEFSFKFSDRGKSFCSGYEQKGSWGFWSEPDEYFHMAQGKIGAIAPDLQIRNEDPL